MSMIALASAIAVTVAAQDKPFKPFDPGQKPKPMLPSDIPDSTMQTLADRVAQAHNIRAWRAHPAFTCNITVSIGGQTVLDGSMTVDTKRDRVRIDLNNGITLVWDGETAWVSPADAPIESPRYHLRTWAFFLKAPFQSDEPGVHVEALEAVVRDGFVLNAYKLTFDETSGRDTPKEWCIGYSDVTLHTLKEMAYISTWGGKSVKEAEREPHVMVFDDVAILNAVVLPRTWRMYHWSAEGGKFGEPVGEVSLKDVSFTQIQEKTFTPAEGAREIEAPKPSPADPGTLPAEQRE